MASRSQHEKNEGIKDDFRVPNLGDWTSSFSLKYLEILIHGITPDKDTLDKVMSCRYLPQCFPCYFSEPHLFHQCKCIQYMEPHPVFLYFYHYSSTLFQKGGGIKNGQTIFKEICPYI